MTKIENKFGSGDLYEADDIHGRIYVMCTACMSIYSEFLSWANANATRIVKDPNEADSIVVLSCQVTELAVLNDLRTMESLIEAHPGKEFYIGGCLARRFDIDLPESVRRLDHVRNDYGWIDDRTLVDFAPPFWINDFKESDDDNDDGHFGRNCYPLRIGAGCTGTCAFCTIRHTRGNAYKLDEYKRLEDEFVAHNDVVLISDNPTVRQIENWCDIAETYKKPISIRNVEPPSAWAARHALRALSKKGLLKRFHTPVQSTCATILDTMKRDARAVLNALDLVAQLRSYGTFTATNIIIDVAPKDGILEKDYYSLVYSVFNYVSWNPMWDGVWDRSRAEEKFAQCFPWSVR